MSRDQILSAYAATRGQYADLQSFLVSEWRTFIGPTKSQPTRGKQSSQGEPIWKTYINQTKSTVSEFLDSLNNTWQEVSNMSQTVVERNLAGKTTQLKNRLTNVANVISRGVGVVKQKLSDAFDRHTSFSDAPSSSGGKRSRKPKPEKKRVNKKFLRQLNKLRDAMYSLDLEQVDSMKRFVRTPRSVRCSEVFSYGFIN